MSTVLLVVHIVFVAIMIGLILLQKSEGGGLGMGGGGLMTARGTANLLTRSTAVMATLFFVSTLVLAMNFKGSKSSESILDAASTKDQAPKEMPAVDHSKPALPTEPEAPATPAAPTTPAK
ncbi:MAG TPA: preprotein translocase subunit SecG [Holosporales bacterium]|nr:preprotein translocase subunit SecG [Holosporales bacterium]